VIVATLSDRSADRVVHAVSSVGSLWLDGQTRQDRYYASHLLGDLKEPRAISILAPLLKDPDINYIVPWSLSQIGDRSAAQLLIGTCRNFASCCKITTNAISTNLNPLLMPLSLRSPGFHPTTIVTLGGPRAAPEWDNSSAPPAVTFCQLI
jgi:hypothetical protein